MCCVLSVQNVDEEPELEVKCSPAAAALQPTAEEEQLSAPVSEEEQEDPANEPASAAETVTPATAPSRCAPLLPLSLNLCHRPSVPDSAVLRNAVAF